MVGETKCVILRYCLAGVQRVVAGRAPEILPAPLGAIDLPADIHHASNLRTPRKIILVLYFLGLEPGRELLRVVVRPAGHPARRLQRTRQPVMIRILFVVSSRIPTDDSIRLDHTDDEDEPADQFVQRNVGHAVVTVV